MYQLDAPFYFYGLGILPILWVAYFLVMGWKSEDSKKICAFQFDGKIESQSIKVQTCSQSY
jgi:hypothetical protein